MNKLVDLNCDICGAQMSMTKIKENGGRYLNKYNGI